MSGRANRICSMKPRRRLARLASCPRLSRCCSTLLSSHRRISAHCVGDPGQHRSWVDGDGVGMAAAAVLRRWICSVFSPPEMHCSACCSICEEGKRLLQMGHDTVGSSISMNDAAALSAAALNISKTQRALDPCHNLYAAQAAGRCHLFNLRLCVHVALTETSS